jgi:hypothetical protein
MLATCVAALLCFSLPGGCLLRRVLEAEGILILTRLFAWKTSPCYRPVFVSHHSLHYSHLKSEVHPLFVRTLVRVVSIRCGRLVVF